ncbi:MAG: glycerol-3-phosphate acyltransferase [Asgard group archaeon]|nr:glycerol-3-phosphate acyltransferase [Asgard group archaeon]
MYQYFIAPLFGYLLGSIPSAWIVVKLFTKKDIREEEQKIITTQQTLDLAGPVAGGIKGLLDLLKGFLSVFFIRYVIFPSFEDVILVTTLAGLGAILGHSWQIWIGFKGGRAYSVFLGTLTILNPWGIPIWIVTTVLVFLLVNYTTIAGYIATIIIAIVLTFFYAFSVPYWYDWNILLISWGYVLILSVKLIPNFILFFKGELPKGR